MSDHFALKIVPHHPAKMDIVPIVFGGLFTNQIQYNLFSRIMQQIDTPLYLEGRRRWESLATCVRSTSERIFEDL